MTPVLYLNRNKKGVLTVWSGWMCVDYAFSVFLPVPYVFLVNNVIVRYICKLKLYLYMLSNPDSVLNLIL